MNDKQLTVFIIVMAFLRTIIDISIEYKDCQHPHIFFVLFLHAIIWIFSYVGCFYNNKLILQIYLLTIILLPIHWMLNNNRCILTEYVNKNCNLDVDNKYDWIFKLKDGNIIAIILRIIFISIAVYKLRKM
jgi:hypothetical protein